MHFWEIFKNFSYGLFKNENRKSGSVRPSGLIYSLFSMKNLFSEMHSVAKNFVVLGIDTFRYLVLIPNSGIDTFLYLTTILILRIDTFRYLVSIPISGIDTHFDTFRYLQNIWNSYWQFRQSKFLFFNQNQSR